MSLTPFGTSWFLDESRCPVFDYTGQHPWSIARCPYFQVPSSRRHTTRGEVATSVPDSWSRLGNTKVCQDTDTEMKFQVEMPGVEAKDAKVSVSKDNVLTWSGKVSAHESSNSSEMDASSSFRNSVKLSFKPVSQSAVLRNGVLTVSLQKPEQVEEGTVHVEVVDGNGSNSDEVPVCNQGECNPEECAPKQCESGKCPC